MGHLGFDVARSRSATGETSRLNVVGDDDDREALGALIGRKGERLSALQHLVNLMLSRRMGAVDPGPRRRRGLPRPARAPARARSPTARPQRVGRDRQDAPARADAGARAALDPPRAARHRHVATQSIGEEPNRRIVVLPAQPVARAGNPAPAGTVAGEPPGRLGTTRARARVRLVFRPGSGPLLRSGNA